MKGVLENYQRKFFENMRIFLNYCKGLLLLFFLIKQN